MNKGILFPPLAPSSWSSAQLLPVKNPCQSPTRAPDPQPSFQFFLLGAHMAPAAAVGSGGGCGSLEAAP